VSDEERTYLPISGLTGEKMETPLDEDLADVLIRMVVMTPLEHHPDVQRVLARYRVSKGRKA
jgi:hypothetical protein